MRDALGAIIVSSPSCFGAVSLEEAARPVMLPPGCAKLATKPLPTGSVE
jgi:hypothetical protein